jgi:hypothetical protein
MLFLFVNYLENPFLGEVEFSKMVEEKNRV